MILVVGATGKLGSSATRMLLAQGQSVRILARSHSPYQLDEQARSDVPLMKEHLQQLMLHRRREDIHGFLLEFVIKFNACYIFYRYY